MDVQEDLKEHSERTQSRLEKKGEHICRENRSAGVRIVSLYYIVEPNHRVSVHRGWK
jgi:hypothetical protein